mgnify:CR=1 FL=1|tara:strand:- start:43635 stop:44465 length:831 start_codon:yes stop_codon:yes gene_type:complete
MKSPMTLICISSTVFLIGCSGMPIIGDTHLPIPKSQSLADQEFRKQHEASETSSTSKSVKLASMDLSLKKTVAERLAADKAATLAKRDRLAADRAANMAVGERKAAERAADRASKERSLLVAAAEKAVDDKLIELESQAELDRMVDPDAMRGESLMQPLVERRAAITATGYAVISIQHHTIPAQQRLLAIRASKLDAYRGLSEQVFGQYLDATTTVADMVIKSDVFRTKVEGIIYGAKVVSINPVGDDTYETTLSLAGVIVEDLRRYYAEQLASAY